MKLDFFFFALKSLVVKFHFQAAVLDLFGDRNLRREQNHYAYGAGGWQASHSNPLLPRPNPTSYRECFFSSRFISPNKFHFQAAVLDLFGDRNLGREQNHYGYGAGGWQASHSNPLLPRPNPTSYRECFFFFQIYLAK